MAVEVIGSANVDLVMTLDRLPGPGETVLAQSLSRFAGGKGANQASASARMGASTRLAGAIGADADGIWLRAMLAATGVDVGALAIKPDQPTGAAHIAVDRRGENQIVVVPGANRAFTAADLPPPDPATRVVLAQGEVPVATILAGLGRCPGLRLFNPAPASGAMLDAFALCDILIVNQHELAAYLAFSGHDNGGDERAGADLLLADGRHAPRQAIIVTLGARGALYIAGDSCLQIPALPVVARDTTGAGDCFCGSLAALLDEGMALEPTLRLASAAAALSTMHHGALAAMPSRADVATFAATNG